MNSTPRIAAVALNRPFDGPLSYTVPDALANEIMVGRLVEVPLGPQKEIGCVVEYPATIPEHGNFRLRPIVRVVSPGYVIDREIFELTRWVAEYYMCSLGEALAVSSMIGFSDLAWKARAQYRLANDWRSAELTKRQREVATLLSETLFAESRPLPVLAKIANATAALLKKLVDAKVLELEAEALPAPFALPPPDVMPELFEEQRAALQVIEASRVRGDFGVFLLHGVTGSGKTEVYLRLIDAALKEGRTALCLVPEIALTPQTVERFERRFQQEVGVFHSQLSRREKILLHEKIRRGVIRIVIGARSAVFSPLPKLGVIIIDEEHDSSYKQGETPRYHARDVAIMRASRLKIPIVLGSATPSFESFDNALKGKFTHLKLTTRPAGLRMPDVRIVPMGGATVTATPEAGMLSPQLRDAIADRLAKGEQSLLFLNRRGFSNFLMCQSCKWVARCPNDDIVLTIHRKSQARSGGDSEWQLDIFPRPLPTDEAFLKCHFCGQRHVYIRSCPKCGEEALVALGTGTQRVEEGLHRAFPGANILRLDQDTIGGRRAFIAAWQKMLSGEAQIILGTQMIAKGLHLERVTLVGVILADVGLFIPDFRAEERTFSLLMQVAGRAGRANMGEVLLQTYLPHHPAIQLASQHNYEAFFDAEMKRRRKVRFPPVERLIALTLSDENLPRVQNEARALASILRRLENRDDLHGPAVLGPQAAPIEKLAARHRQRILIRGKQAAPGARLLRAALAEWKAPSSLNLAIDVDPQDLL
ncbi:primosomal protein N' [Candidatus Sumerlaeota bacterium]|nr:primosomal protein N' [Candidatus Sumerlaeota bacterium]